MVYICARALLAVAWLCFPLLSLAGSKSELPDVVCSPSDPNDCYPRVFEPTEVFQKIREGQDIPPNLHVRLNIYTGEKEARLNIPLDDEESSPVIDIPAEQAMVVVEPPVDIEAEIEAEKPVIPSNAPAYESAGKIVPPPPTGDEMTTFTKAMTLVRMDTRFFDSALSDLVDLSHDIYYGVEIVKDGPIFERLICFLLGSGSERLEAKEKDRDHKAAGILASALQNNPTAMKEAANYWKFAIQPVCGSDTMDKSLKPDQKDFVARLRSKLGKEREPATLRAKVGAISNLLKVPKFRDAFLDKKGMELLLAIFLKKGDQWDATRKKVSQLVVDNFLDESLGAVTGVWPKGPTVGDEVCKTRGKMLQDGCWEYHVEEFRKESGELSWAEDFLSALKERRTDTGKVRSEKEL